MATRRPILALSLALGAACAWTSPQEVHAAPPAASDSAGSSSWEDEQPEHIEWLVGKVDATYRSLDLRRIEYESSAAVGRLIPATAGGPSPGLGLGVRLWFVSLMLHGDVTFLSSTSGPIDDDMQLWNLDLEAAMRFLQGRIQPYLLLGGGYSALAGIDGLLDDRRSEAEAHGANARLGAGVDYYLTKNLTLGLRGGVDGLWLASRVSLLELAEPEKVDTLNETRARLREADGSVAGFAYAAGVTFGMHYL